MGGSEKATQVYISQTKTKARSGMIYTRKERATEKNEHSSCRSRMIKRILVWGGSDVFMGQGLLQRVPFTTCEYIRSGGY